MTDTLTTWRLHWQRRLQGWHRTLDDLLPWRADRLALWLALIGLVLVLLGTLVWLAGRYEASQVQAELERDTQDAVSDLRTALARDVQALQGVQSTPPANALARKPCKPCCATNGNGCAWSNGTRNGNCWMPKIRHCARPPSTAPPATKTSTRWCARACAPASSTVRPTPEVTTCP